MVLIVKLNACPLTSRPGSSEVPTSKGNVVRIPRVGGLLNHYERVA
jgi:hypothetical protein